MGKEEDDPHGIFQGFSSQLSESHNTKVGDHHVGWMGAAAAAAAAPRTPLRTLIARESSLLTTLSQPTDPKSGSDGSGRWNSLDGSKTAGRRKYGSSFKVSPSPTSGASSPSTFGTRHRAFQKVAGTQAELRPVQLVALFAQEREETRSSRLAEDGEILAATNVLVKNAQPPLRDLIAAELLAPTSFRSPSPGNYMTRTRDSNGDNATKPTVMTPESQELRYLFAKDWALQASDEDDEFWDSGSLCGASPSPRSSRRRTKKLQNSKLRHSSSSHSTPPPPQQQHSRMNSPFTTPASIARRLQELQSSPGHGCRVLPSEDAAPKVVVECGPKSYSLGTLLAEEIAATTSRDASFLEPVEPTWSAPSESSRRSKIASLSDISAPVRPESKSQLDFLIAKILTLRANSMEGKKAVSALSAEPNDGGCSTSGSIQQATAVGEQVDLDVCSAATDSSSSSSSSADPATDVHNLSTVDASNPPNSEIEEAPNSCELGETIQHSAITVTDIAAAGELATSIEADGEPEIVEAAAAVQPERVQLGTLLERTRGEHGWLPLGRSRMGSPVTLIASQQPPASSSSRLNTSNSTETCEFLVPPRSSPGSPELVDDDHPTVQHPANPLPETSTITELVVNSLPETAEVASGNSVGDHRPPTQRVSLLSLLNQDMEMEQEDGLHLEVLCGDDDEEDEGEQEARTEELDPMCCVCMVGHKGAAFIPCGHTFCRKCCREVRRSLGSCPLCNQGIVDVLKLY